MADNIEITAGSGTSVATDEIASKHYQRIKLIHGSDGSNDGDVSAVNPLPVVESGNVISAANSSTATLSADAEFTGSWVDALQYGHIAVISKSDVSGQIFVEWSTDSSNVDTSEGTGFSAAAYWKVFSVKARYVRVRYVNGEGGQSYFRLQSILGKLDRTPADSEADFTRIVLQDPDSNEASVVYDSPAGWEGGLVTRNIPSGTQDVSLSGGVSIGNATGKTVVMKTGTLATTAVTADQVVLTYTVTSGKTFYLEYLDLHARLSTFATTATYFGLISLENPSGTKLITKFMAGSGISIYSPFTFAEPIPIPAGTVIRVVCTPNATTNYTWNASFGGYEK